MFSRSRYWTFVVRTSRKKPSWSSSHRRFYQPNFKTKSKLEWLRKFDSLVHNISRRWNRLLLIAGHFSIDLLATECTITKYCHNLPNSHHLFQVIAKPTCKNTSLIDHFITSTSEKIKLNNVLPCCNISYHDGLYIGTNANRTRSTLIQKHPWK